MKAAVDWGFPAASQKAHSLEPARQGPTRSKWQGNHWGGWLRGPGLAFAHHPGRLSVGPHQLARPRCSGILPCPHLRNG
eukprot:154364-Amphidinium_carterae.1